MKQLILLLLGSSTLFVNAQNVGVGTTTPSSRLHVMDSNNHAIVRVETRPTTRFASQELLTAVGSTDLTRFGPDAGSSVAGIVANNLTRLYANSGALLAGTSGNDPLHFVTNGAERMRVEGNGIVGIGTTPPHPSASLHVNTGTDLTKGFVVSGFYGGGSSVPDLGAGSRMMFYPGKVAFRVGYVASTEWDNVNVGFGSVAMGYGTVANANNANAIGFSSVASSQYANAIGYLNIASGVYSTALGDGSRAVGASAFTAGSSCVATGSTSLATGSSSHAIGNVATAMGASTVARGSWSTAMGASSVADGNMSTAMGNSTIARGMSSTVIGSWNDPLLPSGQTELASSTPLFIVGNGDNPSSRSNAMVVQKNGNVGIGENLPTHLLDIKANSVFGGRVQLRLHETDNDFARLRLTNTTTTNGWDIAGAPQPLSANASLNFYYDGLGNNVLSLRGDGNATLAGTLTQLSDARLKKNLRPITATQPLLFQLNAYHYNWRDGNKDTALQTGLLAQEVQAVFPELVQKDEKGFLAVNYTGLIPHLLQAVKEQQRQYDALKRELDELKALLRKQ